MKFVLRQSISFLVTLVALISLSPLGSPVQAQFKDYGTPGFGAGLRVGGLMGKTDLSDEAGIQARGFLSHGLSEKLSAQLGTGYALYELRSQLKG